LFGAAVISRLIFVQIIKHDRYQSLAQGQQKMFSEVQGERGDILLKPFDKSTPYILASNKTSYLCYASSKEIENKQAYAQSLSEILDLEKDFILKELSKDSFYQVIKKDLTEKELSSLVESKLAHIYIGEETKRYYPNNSLASHLIGFFGGEGIGQYGIEGYWDDILTGRKGFIEKGKGPLGFLISLNPEGKSGVKKGSDLLLTIDYNIQFMAEKLLKNAQENLNIEEGQIIIADPDSGRIIALAQWPEFNPCEYSKEENLAVFQNGAIQKLFEPGSIFKPITMSIGLENGNFTPESTYTDPGIIEIGGWPIYNYGKRVYPGEITMTEVLEKSINTGAVWAEQKIGHKKFLEYLEKFEFFELTGIELDGEIFSENRNLKKGYEINFATASFGQGIEITPIQLIKAFSAIANGGILVKPYIVEEVVSPSGRITKIEPKLSESVISEKTSSQISAMMVSVVENGYAKGAQVPGYYVAGKTGTAQISWSALGVDKFGYSDKTIQSFIGFAPAFNPRFLILVKLHNPETKTAEYSALPIFQDLAKYILDYWQIAPDYE